MWQASAHSEHRTPLGRLTLSLKFPLVMDGAAVHIRSIPVATWAILAFAALMVLGGVFSFIGTNDFNGWFGVVGGVFIGAFAFIMAGRVRN